MSDPVIPTAAEVSEAAALHREIAAKTKRLAELKERLVAAGPGDYVGAEGEVAKVIFPAPSIKPDEEAIGVVRECVPAATFKKLFSKVTVLRPVKAFRELVGALVDDKPLARKIVAVCESETSPQVRFS